jgi:hypothetical protein
VKVASHGCSDCARGWGSRAISRLGEFVANPFPYLAGASLVRAQLALGRREQTSSSRHLPAACPVVATRAPTGIAEVLIEGRLGPARGRSADDECPGRGDTGPPGAATRLRRLEAAGGPTTTLAEPCRPMSAFLKASSGKTERRPPRVAFVSSCHCGFRDAAASPAGFKESSAWRPGLKSRGHWAGRAGGCRRATRTGSWTAILLAGERPGGDPLAARFKVRSKALIGPGSADISHVAPRRRHTALRCPRSAVSSSYAQEP